MERVTRLPKQRRTPQRRKLSCLPCRQHKVKCNRQIPCDNCVRHERARQCQTNPSPACIDAVTRTYPHRLNPWSPRPVQPFISHDLQEIRQPTTSSANGIPSPANESECSDPSVASSASRTMSELASSTETAAARTSLSSSFHQSETPFVPLVASAETDALHEWRDRLVENLPSQTQCDFLVSYYYENIQWTYQVLHIPTFRKQYVGFWNTPAEEIDFIWLSLLFTVISSSALCLPDQVAEAMSFDPVTMSSLARTWHWSSRQCLHAGGFESNACLTQLQTFLVTQKYWLSTKNVETLNSCLGHAIRTAQALGLDKDIEPAATLNDEMRHRIWWELCSCDTFQSVCLNRQPFIEAYSSEVPLPSNCNDVDLTETSVMRRPMSEPTVMSTHIYRAQMIRIMNKLYISNGAHLSSLDFVIGLDSEVDTIMSNLPWYLHIAEGGRVPEDSKRNDIFRWQHHLMNTFVCVQRIRMFRPFLHAESDTARTLSLQAAERALSVYKNMRIQDPKSFLKSHRFIAQCYQVFSTAITLALFLLVERPLDPGTLRADIEMSIHDLESLEHRGTSMPVATDGAKVLRKVMELYDLRDGKDESGPVSLVPAIYSVIGGKIATQQYLERCKTRSIAHGKSSQLEVATASNDNMRTGFAEPSLTPSPSMNFDMFPGDSSSVDPMIDLDLTAGMGFEMLPDHFFWQQWES